MPLRRNRARKEVQPKELATGPLRRYKSFLEFYHDMFEHINVVLCAMGS